MLVLPTGELLAPPANTKATLVALGVVLVAVLVLAMFLYQRRKGNRPAPQFAAFFFFEYLKALHAFVLSRLAVCRCSVIAAEMWDRKEEVFKTRRGG